MAMELESYKDRLSATIEGLEAEKLSVTDSIIILKMQRNEENEGLELAKKRRHEEEEKYAKLLMENILLTQRKNKDVMEKIASDRKDADTRIAKAQNLEESLSQRIAKSCAQEKSLSQRIAEIVKREQILDVNQHGVRLDMDRIEIESKKVYSAGIWNQEKEAELLLASERQREVSLKFQNDLEIFKNQRELHEREYSMKLKDLERREGVISKEKARIESEWKQLKSAKSHIDNLKQGNR